MREKASPDWEIASNLIKRCAAPKEITDSVKSLIRRAGARLGFTHSRTKKIWYQETRRMNAGEMDRLRTEVARIEREVAIGYLSDLRQSLSNASQVANGLPLAALDDALCALGAPMCAVDIQARDGRPPPRRG